MSKGVTFVTPWYGAFAGGAEVAARRLALNLSMRGMDVSVYTTCCPTPFDDWWTDGLAPGRYDTDGLKVRRFPVNTEGSETFHRLNAKLVNGRGLSGAEELDYMRSTIGSHELISRIKADRSSTYVFIPYLYGTTFWGVNAVAERSVVIPCLHDEAVAWWGSTRDMMLKAKMLVFLSEEERALAERLYKKDLSHMPVLGVGVNTDVRADGQRFRVKYGIKGPFIVYMGRKDRGKNLLVLIDYVKSHTESFGADLKLVLIGGGDDSLVPSGDPRFVDLGFVPEEDKYDALAASTALCNLSVNESFSFVVMESWLAGAPVIVSSGSSVTRGHVERSGGGFSVGNSGEFSRCVEELTRKPALGRRLAQMGRRYVVENYSWDRVAPAYMEAFRKA